MNISHFLERPFSHPFQYPSRHLSRCQTFVLGSMVFTTVSRVERRLRKQPKKDLGMVKSDLGSNCAEFNFSMGGRKQLLPSEAS